MENIMTKKVLIIEDEAGIANAFKKQLELIAGYEVVWCDKGKEAIEQVKKNKFDVILLDLVMPDFDGVAFLKEYRSLDAETGKTPVIVLTNVTSDETKKEVEEFNVGKYIIKTNIIPSELIGSIEEVTK